MNKNEIVEIVKEFEASPLTKFSFEKGDLKLAMEKEFAVRIAEAVRNPVKEVIAADDNNQPMEVKCEKEGNAVEVRTPIVGIFYEAPSPEDKPYVEEGQEVKAGQVLCLVEAMKMMNEIKAPCDGIIRKIYGVNGQLVEFDQIVFEVEPC